MWHDVDQTAIQAITTRSTVTLGNLSFTGTKGTLFITLPSGRRLAYVKPGLGVNRFGGTSITYWGQGISRKWQQLETYGGKLVENIVQAIARDLLAEAITRIEQAGQHKHARKTQNHIHTHSHTHTKMGRFFFFLSLSLRGASSVYRAASRGAPGPDRRACTEPPPPDCEYCTNPTLETDTHTRGAAMGGGTQTRTPAHTAAHGQGWGGAPPSRVAVRGILCLFKSLYVNADNPESLCTTKS